MINLKEVEKYPEIVVPSVQVVLYRTLDDGKKQIFLGHRVSGAFVGMWSVTGGRIDEIKDENGIGTGKFESIVDAAVREVKEETGIKIDTSELVFFGESSSTTLRTKDGVTSWYKYVFSIYLLDCTDLNPKNVSEDEHSEMKWMSLEDAIEMHREAENSLKSNLGVGEELKADEIIGGLTPRVLETVKILLNNPF